MASEMVELTFEVEVFHETVPDGTLYVTGALCQTLVPLAHKAYIEQVAVAEFFRKQEAYRALRP